ncbi:MAG: S-layer homology domain-containing protein, partial [Peptoniphilus harei]|uniref:S-layer homology domain-containing protein n=1 Tax=Peptoniphilus harei TaxID=54005 RepID=UPI002911A3C9
MSKKVNSLILVLIFMALTCTNAFAAPEFQTSANRDQKIETLQDQGYLHGYVDGSLKLDDKIKRSEFATVIVYALEKQDLAKELQGKSEPFTDVKKDHWANGIISVIKDGKGLNNNVNIIAGYPDGTFKPENKISNAEAIKMLVCLKKSDLTKEMIDNAKWPTSWVAWAKEEGIIGKNSNISEDLDFSAEASRGDVFTMFYNAFMDNNKKSSENSKLTGKSIPVINVRDTERGYRDSHSYNPPFTYEEGRPLTPLEPAEPYVPLTPLEPAEPYVPLTPLEPAEPYTPLTPLEPAETVEEYTLTGGENLEGLTPAKDNGKYNEGTEISFKVEKAGKLAKVEKVVDGKTEELTKDADGKYNFTITADTEIKVTYEDIDYTLTVEDPENGVTNLTPAKDNGKYNEGTEISFIVEKAGKIAKVEKVVDGNEEELTATDGKYSFNITVDTKIVVTYENIYTLTAGEGIENLTEANADDKYKENTEISFTIKDLPGKTAKVEKIVDGNAEELKATDGEYKFTIEADTTIKVTYADIQYTVT